MADVDYDDYGSPDDQGPAPGWQAGPGLQRLISLAGAVASLGLVVGFAVWGYQLAVRDVTGVPVVRALEGPMRIAPTDPGGEITDHQGLAVNGVAEVGMAAPMPDRLILAPRPVDLAEEDTPGLVSPAVPGLADASKPYSGPGNPGAATTDLALAAAPPVESADPTEVAIDAALAEALGVNPDPDPVAEPEVAALTPEPEIASVGAITKSLRPRARPERAAAPAAASETKAEPVANEIDPATIPFGTRLVQVGAYDTSDEARAEWARLAGAFGDLMTTKAMVLQPAESAGRTFFRLRVHGFDDEADANRFCSAFLATEPTCIPVRQR